MIDNVTAEPGARTSPDALSDVTLVKLIASGNEAALSIIFSRYSRVVYAAAFGVVQRREEAEEALQDTFMTLWRKRAEVRLLTESALPWLVAAARNHARNRLRSLVRRRTEQLGETLVDPDALFTADAAARLELSARLDRAISDLMPTDRLVVQLCLVEEMTYEEAGAQLGLTHSSVRNRLARARRTLRTHLSDLHGASDA